MVKSLSLFDYRVFIDGEGRCHNYWLTGQVAASDYYKAKEAIRDIYSEDKILDLRVEDTSKDIIIGR